MRRGPRAPGSGPANEPSSMAANALSSMAANGQRALCEGCQRAFEHGGQRRLTRPTSLRAHPNGGLRGTQQRPPCAAPRALSLRYRSAPRPRGAPRGGLRGGEGNQADTNKKPDLVAKNVTRPGMQISLCGGRSTSWVIDIRLKGSRTSRSCQEGRNPCTWCNTDHPVSGLCEHGRSCCILHHWGSWLTYLP